MDSNVVVALIVATQAIILSVLGFIFKRLSTVKNDARATKDQIVNHHPETPNFRDENDRRHAETKGWFALLFKRQDKIFERMDNVESMNEQLLEYALENRVRIENVEDTQKGSKK